MCGIFSPHLVDFYGKQKIYSYHTCTGMGMISRRAGNFGRELSIAKRGEHDNVSPQRLCGLQWFMSNSPRRCFPQQWLWYFVSRGGRLCHFKLKCNAAKRCHFWVERFYMIWSYMIHRLSIHHSSVFFSDAYHWAGLQRHNRQPHPFHDGYCSIYGIHNGVKQELQEWLYSLPRLESIWNPLLVRHNIRF